MASHGASPTQKSLWTSWLVRRSNVPNVVRSLNGDLVSWNFSFYFWFVNLGWSWLILCWIGQIPTLWQGWALVFTTHVFGPSDVICTSTTEQTKSFMVQKLKKTLTLTICEGLLWLHTFDYISLKSYHTSIRLLRSITMCNSDVKMSWWSDFGSPLNKLHLGKPKKFPGCRWARQGFI